MKNNICTAVKRGITLFVLALLLVLGSTRGHSQNSTISTTFLQMPDTSFLGNTDTGYVVIKNIDNASYSGYINVYYSTDTVAFTSQILCTVSNASLNSGDSIMVPYTLNFDSIHFHQQYNIVVVWSSGNGKMAADTLWDGVYLLPEVAGIHEYDLSSSFSISPNPAKDFIYLKMNTLVLAKEKLQQIRITDISGRIMQEEIYREGEEQKINVKALPPGFYFAELFYTNNKKAAQKFVRVD